MMVETLWKVSGKIPRKLSESFGKIGNFPMESFQLTTLVEIRNIESLLDELKLLSLRWNDTVY